MIDYRELLVKYIKLVYEDYDQAARAVFSDDEWSEIENLTDEARKRGETP